MGHISEFIFSMVMEYSFMLCSVVILDIPILFQTRLLRLTIFGNMWTNHRTYRRYDFDPAFARIIFTTVIFVNCHTAFTFNF